jgi:hypothetical protein
MNRIALVNYRTQERVRAAALELIRQAVGSAGVVAEPASAGADYDAEVLRKGARAIRLRLRPWDEETGQASAPEEVWVLTRAGRRELQRLRDYEQNFVALNGAVRLVRDWLLVDRTDLKAPGPLPRPTRHTDPFADRNSLVARTLLLHPGRQWGIRELASESSVSLGTASQVVKALTAMGAVRFQQSGRSARVWIDDAAHLLRRWVVAYSWERNVFAAFHAPVGDTARFVRRIPTLLGDMRWALTLHAGAAQVAPHATWDRVHVYLDVDNPTDLVTTGERLGWDAAADGRVVLMKPYYRHSVWHNLQMQHGLPVVSTLQLALDLWHYPLRGREQSEHLLKMLLRYDV